MLQHRVGRRGDLTCDEKSAKIVKLRARAPSQPLDPCGLLRHEDCTARGIQRSEVIDSMPIVHVRDEESFENALRRFKRKCEKAGVLTELKKRQYFEKPSVKRKRKALQAEKKIQRKLAEERRAGLA